MDKETTKRLRDIVLREIRPALIGLVAFHARIPLTQQDEKLADIISEAIRNHAEMHERLYVLLLEHTHD